MLKKLKILILLEEVQSGVLNREILLRGKFGMPRGKFHYSGTFMGDNITGHSSYGTKQ